MSLIENYEKIKENIIKAMEKVGRKDFPIIIAVTKTVSPERIKELVNIGIKDVGENYVQEMLSKRPLCNDNFNWHFIGSLQKNKVKYIVGDVRLIHSVDSLTLAEEINRRAGKKGVVQSVLIQVNQGEERKGGVSIEHLETLLLNLNNLSFIDVKGLMAMPPYNEDPECSRPYFKEVKSLMEKLNQKKVYKAPLTELSMGMSGDYAVAVEEGATILRIGTALFGERKK